MTEYQILAKRLRLAVDHALNALSEHVEQEETRNNLKTILENFKKNLNKFDKMLHDKNNPFILKLLIEQRTSLESTADSLLVDLDLSKNTEFEKKLIELLGEEIKAIFKMPATLSLEDLRYEAKALLFESTLENLNSTLQQYDIQGPSCFISYAWGDAAIARKVHKIAQQLVSAGINVVLDIWHNRTNSIIKFTERVYKEDFVLVMGSSLLKQKYESSGQYGSYVREELEHIGIRIKESQDKQKFPFGNGVLKVLIENPYWSAFPDFLKPYPFDETDFTNEHHYYDKFFNLLNLLYVKTPNAIEILSHTKTQFIQECGGLKELTEEELRHYIIDEITEEQKAEQRKSIHDKLEKASAKTKQVSAKNPYHTLSIDNKQISASTKGELANTDEAYQADKTKHLKSIGPLCDPFITTDAFNKLQEMLSDEQIKFIAITQLGGMGKTQLARHAVKQRYEVYINQIDLRKEKILVWELSSDSFFNLASSVKNLVQAFEVEGIKYSDTLEIKYAEDLKRLCRWVYQTIKNRYTETILIFEDAPTLKQDKTEDLFGIQDYLPSLDFRNIKVIITSRREDFFLDTPSYRVFNLEKDYFKTAASELFKIINPQRVNDSDLDALLVRLDYLPLAINLIAHYSKQKRQTCGEIFNILTNDSAFLNEAKFSRLAENNPAYDKTIYAALALPIEAIAQNSDQSDAWELLVFTSLIAYNNIKENLFKNYLALKYPDTTSKELADKLEKSLNIFKNYSLLQFSSLSETYSIHRLVQDVIRNHFQLLDQLTTANVLSDQLINMMKSLNKQLSDPCKYSLTYKHLLSLSHGDLFIENTLALYEGVKDLGFSDFLNTMGSLHMEIYTKESLKLAEKYHRRAFIIRKNILGMQNADVATSYNNLAETYRYLAHELQDKDRNINLKKSVRYHQKALKIREQEIESDPLEIALSYHNLALSMYLLFGNAKINEVIRLYKKAIIIREKNLSFNNMYVATSYSNLGGVLAWSGGVNNLYHSFLYSYIALVISEKQSRPQHAWVMMIHNELGRVLYGLSSESILREIIEFHNDFAISIQKEMKLKSSYPEVVIKFDDLMSNLSYLGSQAALLRAIKHYCQALIIWKNHLKLKNLQVALVVYNLACALEKLGGRNKLEIALIYYCNALSIWKSQFDSNHPNINMVENRLLFVLEELKKFDEQKYIQGFNCNNINFQFDINLNDGCEEGVWLENESIQTMHKHKNQNDQALNSAAGFSSFDIPHDTRLLSKELLFSNALKNSQKRSLQLTNYPMSLEVGLLNKKSSKSSNSTKIILANFRKNKIYSEPASNECFSKLYESGYWDKIFEFHPATQFPIFTFRVYKNNQEVGHAKFYQHPYLCRNLEADQHNLMELTGVLKQLGLDSNLKLDWIKEICASLPPTLKEQIQTSAYHSIKQGFFSGISNVVGYSLKRKGYSDYVSKAASQVVFYGSYFAQSYNQLLNANTVEHDNLAFHTVAAQQALWNTSVMFISNQVINQTSKLMFRAGNKLQQSGWSKMGTFLNGMGRYGYAATYAINGISHGEFLPAVASMMSGTLTEVAVTKAGETIIDNILPNQQPRPQLK